MQPLAGNPIEIGGEVLVGNKMRVVLSAAGNQFAAQAGILIDFEHVNANVGNAGGNDFFEREAPAIDRLVWEAGNQVEIDIGNSGSTQAGNIGKGCFTRVKPPHGGRFFVYEGLQAEADSVDATAHQTVNDCWSQGSG